MSYFLVFISALLLNTANYYPKLYFITWLGFLPLLYLSSKIKGSAFKLGWAFGFFMTAFSSLFVYYSVELFTGLNFWIITFFLIILYLLMGLIYAFWFEIYNKIAADKLSPFYFALSWLVLEFLRYKLLFFYPAGYLAVTQAEFSHFIQLADIGGFWLLSFIIVLVGALIYRLIIHNNYKDGIYILAIFLIVFAYGNIQLEKYSSLSKSYSLGLITSNIRQEIKWDNDQIENNNQLMLSGAEQLKKSDLIIAPETNVTFDFGIKSRRKELLLDEIKNKFEVPLQFGTLSTLNSSKNKYNSSFLISPEGDILQRYNKNILLYFGEKYPAENLINKITPYHFSSLNNGAEPAIFNDPNSEISWKNAICSEILYSDYLLQDIDKSSFIVNQTNEAWFQDSRLLKDLMLSAAILRAVENRKTVVKVGNLAYDAVISPAGELELLPEAENYHQKKIILNKGNTIYSNIYPALELILWALTVLFITLYFKKLF